MQFSTITAVFFASLAVASPTYGGKYEPCGSALYSQAQCCATDVLEVAGLDCDGVGARIDNAQHFVNLCAAKGQRARCCAIPVLGQALLCQEPEGTN
ncbi:unnamed protein product [Zymoseptoria tritici ST99CH_1A5]|uniref:Hydrophobin-like protein n=3 Tax=Zymoseptoria tritici TaxID=1047171 RepID=F9XJU2_ZYMTI|nr:hydrophobin-like protein [Zymoseptoria tritici IPO323]EGP84816.1 hydrophobin-like protein [Zymoseptoria tritici IPO323]SMQ53792.1 unnamed protein product [Zymoseptoria tritici ST99CH_3D7]SMR61205.1 unnamed protein product [Zymoseptoria tritici ST99CH_3D1]SMY27428.1 unnamed protein product [Zymoseptoria tritici ST99CH_1A5]